MPIVSAAIYGLRNKANISIFILYPQGRVSPIQEAQMTTVTDPNVHNLAVTGSFDDCQVPSVLLCLYMTWFTIPTGRRQNTLFRPNIQCYS